MSSILSFMILAAAFVVFTIMFTVWTSYALNVANRWLESVLHDPYD